MYDLLLPMPEQKPVASSRAAPAGWRLLVPNLVLFQAGGFAAVLGAAHGMAWLGPAVIAVILAFHLYRASKRAREAGLVLAALLVGLAFESLLALTGWVAYPGPESALAPLWMITLWANFAATLNVGGNLFDRPCPGPASADRFRDHSGKCFVDQLSGRDLSRRQSRRFAARGSPAVRVEL